jgi:hypothetical protein
MKVLLSLAYLAIFLFTCYGWVMNIVKLFGMATDTITGELVVRIVGIFIAPIGVVAGYL